MLTRLIVTLLLLTSFSQLIAQNYADDLLDQYAQQVKAKTGSPLERLLLAENIYYLAHETSRQEELGALLEQLYEGADHQELKAEVGFFLTQHLRQLGKLDRLGSLTRDLGYVAEWQVLGPLAPKRNIALKDYIGRRVKGLDRSIQAHKIRSYGAAGFLDEGIGHFGYFSANQAIYPNQLAGGLFTTWFQAPEKGNYRVSLGWDHYASVWINRTQIYNGQENQDPHPEQMVKTFKLAKGWHRLTLYIESKAEKPNLGFYARLTDEAGKPLTVQARPGRKIPKKKPVLVKGETSLLEQAENHSSNALAILLLHKEYQFHAEHGSPKDILSKAFSEKPTRDITDRLLPLTEDANERLQILRAFSGSIPESGAHNLDRAWAFTELGQLALDQGRFWEARNYSDRARASYPDYWPASVLQSNVFSALGLHGEALRVTSDLSTQYPGVPWLTMDLSDLYWSMGFSYESEEQTDRILSIRSGSAKFSERKIKMLKSRGDLERLDTFYGDVLKNSPYSVTIMLNYAQFLIANEKLDKADALLSGALAQMPENPFLLEGMGELRLTQSNSEAMSYFERSLALRPQNPKLEKRLALSRKEISGFYMPYRIEQAPDVEVLEVTPIVINYDNTVTKVAFNGQSSVYHQLEYEIINEQGAQELPGYSFSYAPLRQNAELIRAELLRGEQVVPLTQFGRSRISDPAYRMYYDLVAYQIGFPSLEPGDRISLEYRIDDVDSTNIFGDYFGDLQYFAQSYPVKRKSYTLIMPSDRKIYYHVEKMKPKFTKTLADGYRIYSWSLDQISSYETESRMPGLLGYLPYIGISTFDDWQAMASWYKELIENQLILDHETKAIVANLISGVTDPLEIVKKVHEYVVTNTRYVALEFGIHGYKPYQVNQVCSRQFGDCKDKASLIVAMLREAGIDASVVITRTSDRGEVHTFPAMLTYFNHAIVHVPQFNLFLDGTAEFSGIDELPEMDQGALVLIVDKDGKGTLTTTPVLENNHQRYALEMKVQPGGSAEIRGRLSYEGKLNPELRQYLSIDTKLHENVEKILGDLLPGLAVTSADRQGVGLNDAISLNFEGVSDRLFQKSGGGMKLPLNILSNQLTQTYAANAKRKYPIEVGSPSTRSIEVLVDAPDGYTIEEIPELLEVEDDNLQIRITVDRIQPTQCRVLYELTFKTPRIEPEAYESLRSMMQAHDRILDQSINFVVQ